MRAIFTSFLLALLSFAPASAQEKGPVTNLPLPRYVSMKASEGYARNGPSQTHRIDWVYKHRNQPLQIVAEYGHWRRVVDPDGLGGWMHYTLLSGVRFVMIQDDLVDLHRTEDPASTVVAQLELGVVARLGDCTIDRCELTAGGRTGWAPKSVLWGVDADELRE